METPDAILTHLLDTPADTPADREEVKALTERCPSFLLPDIIMLRHPHPGLTAEETAAIVGRIALSLPDRRRLAPLLDPEGTGRYDRFYPAPARMATPSTDDAIDTFLSTYGDIDPEEEALLNRMIFNPVPDYAATLEREHQAPSAPTDEQDRLLDAFIAADHTFRPADETAPDESRDEEPPAPRQEPQAPKAPAGSLLSESLAKIFIKQHNYKRAYEIIRSLSLNYPEKSIYFADQLRFLAKLIKNQEAGERLTNKN